MKFQKKILKKSLKNINNRKVASYSRKKIHKESSLKSHTNEKSKYLSSIIASKKKYNEFLKDIKICLSKVKNKGIRDVIQKKLENIKNLKKYPKKKLIDLKFKTFDLCKGSETRYIEFQNKSKNKIKLLKNSKYQKRGISHHNEKAKLINEENCIKRQISLLKNLKKEIITEYKNEIKSRIKLISKNNKENISKDKKRNQIFHLILFENKNSGFQVKEKDNIKVKIQNKKSLNKKHCSQSKNIRNQKQFKMKIKSKTLSLRAQKGINSFRKDSKKNKSWKVLLLADK